MRPWKDGNGGLFALLYDYGTCPIESIGLIVPENVYVMGYKNVKHL